MALTTFGAIMGFAAESAAKAKEIYDVLAEKAHDATLMEVLQGLSEEEEKNHALMLKTRRENVTEMILEPVTDLHQEDYEIDLKTANATDDAGLLKTAAMLEDRGRRFFRDASLKVSLPEVGRIFRKMAQRKEANLAKLQSLGLSQAVGNKG